ncbi:sugar-binding domain-containing protein [Filimonas effusa]|uniref:Beta-galactosidase n=1 Tax=Filimonas effusa TaxID=2508721 RepID=A0A4Q1D8L3_9BACT|nr:sugar-binding domain-containing protein [Filimonas effusa]RXK85687.1 beta-galactosidase [Filimonas effusa]
MKYLSFALLVLTSFSVCAQEPFASAAASDYRQRIDLKGEWQFAIDAANKGIQERWFLKDLPDRISLPGTMDEGHKGRLNKDTSTMHLNRLYLYEGAAWYRKKVIIPKSFRQKHSRLLLERTKSTMVWIDGKAAGSSCLLQSPQEFDISSQLTPGEHFITIRVDNSLKLTPYGNVHIYSDDTQTNWNGIIGQLFLEASAQQYIKDLQVYPDIAKQSVQIRMRLANTGSKQQAMVKLLIKKQEHDTIRQLLPVYIPLTTQDSVIVINHSLAEDCSLWDEYRQPLYELTAIVKTGKTEDALSASFGMRRFEARGTQFNINGNTCFLRGKHDACVFPLTGHPPMDVEGWLRVFNIAKSYGINHYRFHSYCPPEAAFTAADRTGMYLQVELPFWGGLDSDTVAEKLKQEGRGMLKYYANHASFVLFSHGNEIWGGHKRAERNIAALKQYDSRPLYTLGSNVNIGYYPPSVGSDFFVGARTPSAGDTILTHTRLTHAFPDSREGGLLNTRQPSTMLNFRYAVSQLKVPIISHETGQYQVYPDYSEVTKYTGVLKPWNLEIFRNRLQKAGMIAQAGDFQKASGAWAALCYKAEMEAALRTEGFGGFQLLDLQDFPGQGTALVGILDAFMDSKNVISSKEWLQSCNDVTLLAEFPKYVWTNGEQFHAKVRVANYSNKHFPGPVNWEMRQGADVIAQGVLQPASLPKGGLTTAGVITIPFEKIATATRLQLNLFMKDHGYTNSYPIWVYPEVQEAVKAGDILVTSKYDDKAKALLAKGGKVLLFPEAADVKDNSLPGLFPPEFWNWEMFKSISESSRKPVSPGTLGLLMNPEHPLFKLFPTDFHTNWQWFSIVKGSRPLILDQTPSSFKPLVQVIDNLQRNHKLGLIFEFRAGGGKLLVCMAELPKLLQYAAANQLYRSILSYMQSADFDPVFEYNGGLPERKL